MKLAKKFAEKVGAELAILNKERPAQQVAEIAYVIGDVKDKTAVIVDDIIDTAGTLRAAGETVKDEGAQARLRRRHAPGALRQRVREPRREPVRADRDHGHDPAAAPARRTTSPSCRVADLLTDSIRRIFTDDSVAEVFGGENQLF